MKILVGVFVYFSFSIILWVSTEVYFYYIAVASSTRGLTSALLDALVLVILVSIARTVLCFLFVKPGYHTTYFVAAAIWTIGWFLLKIGMPRGAGFQFFAYGQTLIENGEITESGCAIYLAILLSRITTILVTFFGATLASSYFVRNTQ
ncbi:hypothetical protein [Parasedimentitalea huanghaiensis]|uniref:Uncharacterized protein n=1 Tax=Parasedimentitalea huanghaiensis TaxID=2682100 RepID=A0A6L6WB95_9RHOB|nr:hypothetical protein [Zongyanglinia huanghaiensis]MVO14481.1 hypothetical protein [Zongyanglinia huanghaiensis]